MKAFVLVNTQPGKTSVVLAALRRIEVVKFAHACWGRPDVLVLVEVENEPALRDLVIGGIQSIAGIESTDTHIVID